MSEDAGNDLMNSEAGVGSGGVLLFSSVVGLALFWFFRRFLRSIFSE